ncbi:MAG: pyridoxamine 5'-phosphate oxidase family protein [Actinomycetota bacterium]
MDWPDVVGHAIRLGPDCFLATVTPQGKPHLAVISPGFIDQRVIVATWESSVKADNLRAGSAVMLHWVVREETDNDMLLIQGIPRLVDDAHRSRQLWEADCLPYDPADWYQGPDDPELLWVEIEPTYASLHRNLGEGDSSVWHCKTPDSHAP